MLKNLALPEGALRAHFEADTYEDFADYDCENISDFDRMLVSVSQAVNDILRESPVNAALAGDRPAPVIGVLAPTEGIDLCLIADLEGCVDGYMWSYDLWGARRLSLLTTYREGYRGMRTDADGIDGCIEMADAILALVNDAIDNFNGFVGGTR